VRRGAQTAFAALVIAVALGSCGSQHHGTTGQSSGAAKASPGPAVAGQQMASTVQTYAREISKELTRCPGASSNPYDYVASCPTYRKMVALGPSALPAIAHYILDHKANGLDGYVVAIAGDAIWGSHGTPIATGAKSWETSDQWARQYLAWAQAQATGN
jgi:hypothetical protein